MVDVALIVLLVAVVAGAAELVRSACRRQMLVSAVAERAVAESPAVAPAEAA